jgi:hypothetical protein
VHVWQVSRGLADRMSTRRSGGLGVLDLRFFGFALRLRWEWLARKEPQRCWDNLPLRTEKNVAAMFAVGLSVVVGDGTSGQIIGRQLDRSIGLRRPYTLRRRAPARGGCYETPSSTTAGLLTSSERRQHRCSVTF